MSLQEPPHEGWHDVKMVCAFCASEQVRQMPPTVKSPKYWPACERCLVHGEKGSLVRYGAPERVGGEARNYDSFLKRGALYVVRRVRQEQHARYFTLEGINGRDFRTSAFVPVPFAKELRLTVLRQFYMRKGEEVDTHPLDCICRDCTNFVAAGVRLAELEKEAWPS
jgi:hypothetical protein